MQNNTFSDLILVDKYIYIFSNIMVAKKSLQS